MRRLFSTLLLVLVFSACNRSPESALSSNVTAKKPAASPHPPRLVTGTISDPKTFNALTAVDMSSSTAMSPILEGLVRTDVLTLENEPMLAASWEHNGDGTVWTFHLRHNVKWHDGQPFTAKDVLFTFDAIYDDKVANSIKHILTIDGQRIKADAPDEYTVRLTLPRPFAPLLNSMSFDIFPAHLLADSLKKGTFSQEWGIDTPPEKLVGTGAYTMSRYVPAQFIEYQRNPNYWMKDEAGAAIPYLEGQTQLIVSDLNTLYLKFLGGQTDLHAARPEDVADLRRRTDELAIRVEEVGLDTGSTFIAFNRNPSHYLKDGKQDPRLGWFTDIRFLRALAHAVDKQAMVVNCLNGYGKPGVGEISPENKLYHNPDLVDYEYDLNNAKQILDDAGYKDRDGDGTREDEKGNPIEFSLTTNAGNDIREKMCSILKEDWTKLGLKVNFRPLDFQALVERLYTTYEWDAVLIGFTGTIEPNSSANFLRSNGNLHFWQPNQPEPATPWEAEIDRLLDQGSREIDTEKRRPLYWRIQQLLHEQLPIIQTVRQTNFRASRLAVKNYKPTVWGTYREELIRIAE